MSSLYTTQALTIIIIFGFSFAMGTAIRNQIWEKESKNAQVRNVQTMYGVKNLEMAIRFSL